MCAAALLVLMALIPLPFGAARPWAWSLAAVWVGAFLLIAASGRMWRGFYNALGRTGMAALIFAALAAAWVSAQALLPVSDWSHPLRRLPEVTAVGPQQRIAADIETTLSALLRFLSAAGTFCLAVAICAANGRARWMLKWMSVITAVYCMFAVFWQTQFPGRLLWFEKWSSVEDATGPFVNSNTFATYAGLGLLANLTLLVARASDAISFAGRGGWRLRAVLHFLVDRAPAPIIGIGACATALALSHSRGGFLATAAGLVLFLGVTLRHIRGRRFLATAVAGMVLIGLVLVMSEDDTIGRLLMVGTKQEGRADLLVIGMNAFLDRPLLGHGYGTFEQIKSIYDPEGLTIYPFYSTHDLYLDLALELGLPVAIVLVTSVGIFGWLALQLSLSRRENWVPAALGASAFGLVAVHSLVDFTLYVPAIACTFACMLGLSIGACSAKRQRFGLQSVATQVPKPTGRPLPSVERG